MAWTWAANIAAGGRRPGGRCSDRLAAAASWRGAGAGGGAGKVGVAGHVHPAFEHRHVMARKPARKGQIGPARRLERCQRAGFATVIGMFHQVGENLEPLQRAASAIRSSRP
jgi:hypothetical protein